MTSVKIYFFRYPENPKLVPQFFDKVRNVFKVKVEERSPLQATKTQVWDEHPVENFDQQKIRKWKSLDTEEKSKTEKKDVTHSERKNDTVEFIFDPGCPLTQTDIDELDQYHAFGNGMHITSINKKPCCYIVMQPGQSMNPSQITKINDELSAPV